MATFRRDDVTLSYDDIGQGDPPIVLLHGLGTDKTIFAPQVERFGGAHRLVLPDLRGHGSSSHVPFSVSACADDVAALCEDRGLGKPVVVGFSLGGTVALDIAARHGDRFSGAVLLDPPLLFRPDLIPGMAEIAAGVHSPRVVETWVRFAESTFTPFDDPKHKGPALDLIRRTPGDVLTSGFDSSMAFDPIAALRACRIPLLFIAANMPTEVYTLNTHCPHAWWGRTVGAGHFAHVTAADQVNPMIARFLQSLAVPAR
jgi:pimeloyl-ACP methyl ester carboxylesterase